MFAGIDIALSSRKSVYFGCWHFFMSGHYSDIDDFLIEGVIERQEQKEAYPIVLNWSNAWFRFDKQLNILKFISFMEEVLKVEKNL